MFETLRRRVETARRGRALAELLAQRRAQPRDRALGLAIHAAIRSGETFRAPLINGDDASGGARTLIVIERSVDHMVLEQYLRAIPHRAAYIQDLLPADSTNAASVTPALSLVGQGTADDIDLARTTESLAAGICRALDRHVPRAERVVVGVDPLAVVDFHLGDRLLNLGRNVRGLIQQMRSGDYDSVAFLVGNHQLWQTLDPVAKDCVGAENVHVFWLPRLPGPAMSGSELSPDAEGSPRIHTIPSASPSVADVALLVDAQPRFIREMRRVALEVARNHHVTLLAPAHRVEAHARNGGHLTGLVGEHPDRFSFVCPDSDTPAEPPLDVALSNAVLTDEAVKALTLDGAVLYPSLKPIVTATLADLADARRFAIGFDAYLRSFRPTLLVVCPDRTPEARVACQLARIHGVTSYYPVPGMTSAHPSYRALQADYGSVMDDSQVEIRETAHPEDRGRFFADGVTNLDAATEAWLSHHGRTAERACVALALQPMSSAYNEVLIELVGGALDGIDADFVVRAHPRESQAVVRRYRELVSKLPRAAVDDGGLTDLLDRATLVVGGFSAVLVEAAIVGRPVLSINLGPDPFPVQLGDMGIATEVHDTDSARSAIRDLLTSPEVIAEASRRQDEYFERNPHLRARPAAVGIAHRIDSLLQSSSGHGD